MMGEPVGRQDRFFYDFDLEDIAASGDPAAPVDLARGSVARSRCCLWKPVSKPRLAVRG
jgi:hypothetical protein